MRAGRREACVFSLIIFFLCSLLQLASLSFLLPPFSNPICELERQTQACAVSEEVCTRKRNEARDTRLATTSKLVLLLFLRSCAQHQACSSLLWTYAICALRRLPQTIIKLFIQHNCWLIQKRKPRNAVEAQISIRRSIRGSTLRGSTIRGSILFEAQFKARFEAQLFEARSFEAQFEAQLSEAQ
jgi:hypothetical protein